MRKHLTIRELEHIKASFHTLSDAQLAQELGRTAASVAQIRFKYGLIKGKSTKQKAPDEFHIKRSVGCKPYLNIKIGRKWVSYHRHIWEQAHGPIPAGMVLAFINGDTLDVCLENLELLTRAENLKRNQNREKAGQTIKRIRGVVSIMESIGMRHRYGYKSKYFKHNKTA